MVTAPMPRDVAICSVACMILRSVASRMRAAREAAACVTFIAMVMACVFSLIAIMLPQLGIYAISLVLSMFATYHWLNVINGLRSTSPISSSGRMNSSSAPIAFQ